MSYTVLARKYRPQTFEEVYAQDHITRILVNAIEMKRVAQAYLFAGPRGVGKTSMARILAKSLNCEKGASAHPCNECSNCTTITNGSSQDVVEIDGASNTSVDDVRDLQKDLIYATATSVYKIYIIDEVHMLSKNAFNALLKTLEEPPENVIFIFATTEPHKVLPTILSRCQRFDFKSIPVESIVKRLKDIAVKEKVHTDEESLYIIAQKADGGLRDALSLFDQVISYCGNDITFQQVQDIFGILPYDLFVNILNGIHKKDFKGILSNFHTLIEAGKDLQEFLSGFMEFIRKLLLIKIGVTISDIPVSMISQFNDTAELFEQNTLLYFISILMKLKNDIKSGSNSVMLTEITLLKMSKVEDMIEISDLVERVNQNPGISNLPKSNLTNREVKIPKIPVTITEVKADAVDNVKESRTNLHPLLTFDILKTQWKEIVETVKSRRSVVGRMLEVAEISNVTQATITLTADNDLVRNSINEHEQELLNLINSTFNASVKHLKVNVISVSKEKKSDFTMNNIEEKAPDLAKFIKTTDSIVKQL